MLEPSQTLTLDDAEGVHVRPHEGKLWVTEEGVFDDFVVRPGDDFTITQNGRTSIQALDHTSIDLVEHSSCGVSGEAWPEQPPGHP
jgi:hypothetical protein